MTNYEYYSMGLSVDEMARAMMKDFDQDTYPAKYCCENKKCDDCEICMKNWLNAEREEEQAEDR